LVARRVARQSQPPTEARAELVTAAVLFADISGFTALTEGLARHGAEGAEELTQNLNI
jgi:class 3 adenylate cyclase